MHSSDGFVQTLDTVGYHNGQMDASRDRLMRGNSYRDCSTIMVVPTRGMISARVVQSWLGMIQPMNQKFTRAFVVGMEVGQAYSNAVDNILLNPELSKWRYMLTVEEDNLPPPDGLLKLIEDIESGPWDAVGGLYWTKGVEQAQPMCYGQPTVFPKNFLPFLPPADAVTECNGLGMGFTLFRMSMFQDERLSRPFFETIQRYTPGVGCAAMTQDLAFFEKAGANGHRFACSTRVLVGHYDVGADIVY